MNYKPNKGEVKAYKYYGNMNMFPTWAVEMIVYGISNNIRKEVNSECNRKGNKAIKAIREQIERIVNNLKRRT